MQFHKDKIIIIDFGSQLTKLIARRVRDLGVYSEIIQPKDLFKQKISENTILSSEMLAKRSRESDPLRKTGWAKWTANGKVSFCFVH